MPGLNHRTMVHSPPARILFCVALAALIAGAGRRVDAAPVPLTNIYNSVSGNSVTSSITVTQSYWAAGKFTFPSVTNGYQLAAVNIMLSSIPTSGSVELSVFADAGTKPSGNTPIATLTNPGSLKIGSNSFNSTAILTANTSYWIVLKGTGGGTATWSSTTGTVTGSGANRLTATYSTALGGQWSELASDEPFMMQIYVVPEPSTWAMGLAGLGVAGVGALRRRSRRGPASDRGNPMAAWQPDFSPDPLADSPADSLAQSAGDPRADRSAPDGHPSGRSCQPTG